jgi:hypothetical protein
MKGGRAFSVRLGPEHEEIALGLARLDNTSVGEVIRQALLHYGDERRKSPDFPKQIEEAKRQLETLSVPASSS